jgi:hypothetical protein
VRDLQQRKGRPFVGDTQSGIAGEEAFVKAEKRRAD